jgi:alkylhydroperoxidase/carboxymuconolactone decarboxylase family protein YurZ
MVSQVDKLSEHPLKVYERLDPEALKRVEENRKFAMAGEALPLKFKLLLIMALDASQGAAQGVRANAAAALRAGATKEEVAETIRVTQYACGVGSTYVTAHALENMF